jgi:DNA polymerase III sliding clamp (beta) subunit (PCNA family)
MFRASDMEKYVEVELPADIDLEGSLTINARKLSDYVKTIEDEEVKLQIDTGKNTLTIKTSNDNIKLNGIAGSEYLGLPVVT